jgi:hypothetical protein
MRALGARTSGLGHFERGGPFDFHGAFIDEL